MKKNRCVECRLSYEITLLFFIDMMLLIHLIKPVLVRLVRNPDLKEKELV